jgi:DNA polymerase III epsilon subunit-like protein
VGVASAERLCHSLVIFLHFIKWGSLAVAVDADAMIFFVPFDLHECLNASPFYIFEYFDFYFLCHIAKSMPSCMYEDMM